MNANAEWVKLLKFRFMGHKHETIDFTLDYIRASDSEIFELTPVREETIQGLAKVIMNIISPGQRKKLKQQIAYLIGLRHRQGEVWQKKIEEYQQRQKNCEQWVIKHTKVK